MRYDILGACALITSFSTTTITIATLHCHDGVLSIAFYFLFVICCFAVTFINLNWLNWIETFPCKRFWWLFHWLTQSKVNGIYTRIIVIKTHARKQYRKKTKWLRKKLTHKQWHSPTTIKNNIHTLHANLFIWAFFSWEWINKYGLRVKEFVSCVLI